MIEASTVAITDTLKEDQEAEARSYIRVFSLATPLIAGRGDRRRGEFLE
jgi:hypothetical protein